MSLTMSLAAVVVNNNRSRPDGLRAVRDRRSSDKRELPGAVHGRARRKQEDQPASPLQGAVTAICTAVTL